MYDPDQVKEHINMAKEHITQALDEVVDYVNGELVDDMAEKGEAIKQNISGKADEVLDSAIEYLWALKREIKGQKKK